MKYIAAIDTPWLSVSVSGETSYAPALPHDPLFADRIKGWRDVTGEEGAMLDGKMLYGGNYALDTGIQPDPSVGRLGGSGEPDRLIIECTTDDPDLWADIDAAADYWVLWTEEIEEEEGPVTRAASLDRPREAIPPQAEFGQWRSWLAQQGIPQGWIDEVYGTGNTRSRGKNDSNGRQGYLTKQYGGVNLRQVILFLAKEDWTVERRPGAMMVLDGTDNYIITVRKMIRRDFADLPEPLTNDIMEALA